jgi:hypothetical protein
LRDGRCVCFESLVVGIDRVKLRASRRVGEYVVSFLYAFEEGIIVGRVPCDAGFFVGVVFEDLFSIYTVDE